MSDFTTYTLSQEALDPTKRVRYSTGLVLGVDEFLQQDVHFIERDRLHNRSLHGYGTVCGLAVSQRDSAEGPEIVVTAGLAVNPQGQEIRVPVAQCARLNSWLARNRDEVEEKFGSPPAGLAALNVVLCYQECETDLVPIPGEPCRTQDDSMAPSRIADDFKLSLVPVSPEEEQSNQVEEETIRRFGELLCRIRLSDGPGTLGAEELAQLVRGLQPSLVEASPPDDILLSPPVEPGEPILLQPDQAGAILRHAFRIWVTEVRPALLPCGKNCAGGPPDESCVLLARLEFPVDQGADGNLEVAGEVTIDQERRPYLLQTRLLQEWLMCGRSVQWAGEGVVSTFATLFVLDPTTIRAWVHHPFLLDIPTAAVSISVEGSSGPPALVEVTQSSPPELNIFDLVLDGPLEHGSRVTVSFDTTAITELTSPGQSLAEALAGADYGYLDRQAERLLAYLVVDLLVLADLFDVDISEAGDGWVLTRRDGRWVAEEPSSTGVSDHGALSGLADDDHPQYLLADGSRPLGGDLSAGNNRITNLAEATSNGDALRFEQGIKVNDAAGGDLRGTYPNPLVRRLQGRNIANVAPQNGQVLTWNVGAGRWEPQNPQAAAGNFVQIPAAVGPYAIVAAGFFRPDGSPIGPPANPTYNKLEVVGSDPSTGEYTLHFNGYNPPPDGVPQKVLYIVKGTIVDQGFGKPRATFQFVEFNERGIVVRVLATNNEPVQAEQLFMVEISAFGELEL